MHINALIQNIELLYGKSIPYSYSWQENATLSVFAGVFAAEYTKI